MRIFIFILFSIVLKTEVTRASLKEGPSLCKSLGSLKSEASPRSTIQSLSLSMDASLPVQISWINFEGKPEPKTRPMDDGRMWAQISYFNHWWLFTDKTKKCLAIYSAQTLSKIKKIDNSKLGISEVRK
jgi:hypothetical protein